MKSNSFALINGAQPKNKIFYQKKKNPKNKIKIYLFAC